MAAAVAPVKVSVGNLLFVTGRFHLAMTTITPRNEIAFTKNAVLTPARAMITPPNAGPTARARLNSIPLRARAGVNSDRGTNSGKMARQAGDSIASPMERAKVSSSRNQGLIRRRYVAITRITDTASIQVSVPKISLRRSTMSPIEPAGSASRKKGKAEAVWISAICSGLLLSEVISQAAPTACMNAPMSETRSAISKFRKSGMRSGLQGLEDAAAGGFALSGIAAHYTKCKQV